MSTLKTTTTLANGVEMPMLGLGTWQADNNEQVVNAVTEAINVGYRLIDTASLYHNEEGVGKAIQQVDIPRQQLFITTKVWNSDQGYENTLKAFEVSRKKLGLDYLDLYLIHWPVKAKYKETWKALEKLYKDGLVKAIGVSNFHPHHLDDLIADAEIIPMLDQVELHPLLIQQEVRTYCRAHNVQLQSWSPLMQGHLDIPVIDEVAEMYHKTPPQVILNWNLCHNISTIPKSITPARIKENAEIFDFMLNDEDVIKLDSLNKNKRFSRTLITLTFNKMETII